MSRSDRRPQAELYPFGLQDPISPFQLPLRHEDTELLGDLQALLQGVYDQAGFDLAIDYTREPVPVLSEANAIWVNTLLQQQ